MKIYIIFAFILFLSCDISKPTRLVNNNLQTTEITEIKFSSLKPLQYVGGKIKLNLNPSDFNFEIKRIVLHIDDKLVSKSSIYSPNYIEFNTNNWNDGAHKLKLGIVSNTQNTGLGNLNDYPIIEDTLTLNFFNEELISVNIDTSYYEGDYPKIEWKPSTDPRFSFYLIKRNYNNNQFIDTVYSRHNTSYTDINFSKVYGRPYDLKYSIFMHTINEKVESSDHIVRMSEEKVINISTNFETYALGVPFPRIQQRPSSNYYYYQGFDMLRSVIGRNNETGQSDAYIHSQTLTGSWYNIISSFTFSKDGTYLYTYLGQHIGVSNLTNNSHRLITIVNTSPSDIAVNQSNTNLYTFNDNRLRTYNVISGELLSSNTLDGYSYKNYMRFVKAENKNKLFTYYSNVNNPDSKSYISTVDISTNNTRIQNTKHFDGRIYELIINEFNGDLIALVDYYPDYTSYIREGKILIINSETLNIKKELSLPKKPHTLYHIKSSKDYLFVSMEGNVSDQYVYGSHSSIVVYNLENYKQKDIIHSALSPTKFFISKDSKILNLFGYDKIYSIRLNNL